MIHLQLQELNELLAVLVFLVKTLFFPLFSHFLHKFSYFLWLWGSKQVLNGDKRKETGRSATLIQIVQWTGELPNERLRVCVFRFPGFPNFLVFRIFGVSPVDEGEWSWKLILDLEDIRLSDY